VTIALKDKENGNALLDMSAIDSGTAEGCGLAAGVCTTARDGKLASDKLMVHGPRGNRRPVLTTNARVKIVSNGAGPFAITATADLSISFDGGKDVYKTTNGGYVIDGTVTVSVPAATYTSAQLVTLLNDDADFAARGIAVVDAAGMLELRSRQLGDFPSIQLLDGAVTTTVFNGDTAVKTMSGYYVYAHFGVSSGDPKVTYSPTNVSYTLDPVDDLEPGTYVVSVEIADRGRKSSSDYKTPSVAKLTFQVGQETEELVPAGNCASCHQNESGKGYILDFARHYKIFDDTAIDQCGACHDNYSQKTTGGIYGGKPIGKRVHAIHYGSSLNYPLLTVDYGGGDPVKGRNWEITLPQDVRNCESCHASGTTSGSWKTNAGRLACSGCHDSDSAQAHYKLMTYDPTPDAPWNGDEEESCKVCH